MSEVWIGLIGALSGTAVGGLVTYLVEHAKFRREKKWEWATLRREKLEEIGQVTEEFRQHYASVADAALKHSKGIMANLPRIEEASYPLPRLMVLIRFYAPELEAELGALADKENVVKATVAVLAERSRLDDGRFNLPALDALLRAEEDLGRHCAILLGRLTKSLDRKYHGA